MLSHQPSGKRGLFYCKGNVRKVFLRRVKNLKEGMQK